MSLALEETHEFISAHLAGRRRILEVGCGEGQLASWLARDGFDVTAIDLHLHLRAGGVARENPRFLECDLLAFEETGFDAVLFTASLHHISPLDAAIARAREALAPGGVLIADEFDLAAPDAATARWHFDMQQRLAVEGVHPMEHIHGDPTQKPLARWKAEHEHTPPLHEGAAMIAAIRRQFSRVEVTTCAYLYRYLCAGLAENVGAERAKAEEENKIAAGELQAVGLRITASR